MSNSYKNWNLKKKLCRLYYYKLRGNTIGSSNISVKLLWALTPKSFFSPYYYKLKGNIIRSSNEQWDKIAMRTRIISLGESITSFSGCIVIDSKL